MKRSIFMTLAALALVACQQTPEQQANAAKNAEIMNDSAADALVVPANACARFYSTGVLPKADLAAAGFGEANIGYVRQVTPGSFSVPGGTKVLLSIGRRDICNITVTNAPFRLLFARNAAVRGLMDDGWEHQGDLIYTKGDRRIRLTGGASGLLVTISMVPK
ncbi:hypothetical protein [Shimia ponticola]|uniref:hypothetical protein n=1 Tax=Shimia ponticola TaxID=2582893 RepID=UPI0011BD655E|nr:hypothetical protein [Shimia ponticola]